MCDPGPLMMGSGGSMVSTCRGCEETDLPDGERGIMAP
jgi:hypothetical protein